MKSAVHFGGAIRKDSHSVGGGNSKSLRESRSKDSPFYSLNSSSTTTAFSNNLPLYHQFVRPDNARGSAFTFRYDQTVINVRRKRE